MADELLPVYENATFSTNLGWLFSNGFQGIPSSALRKDELLTIKSCF